MSEQILDKVPGYPDHDHYPTCGEDFCEGCGDCVACNGMSDGYCAPCWLLMPWKCCVWAQEAAAKGNAQ